MHKRPQCELDKTFSSPFCLFKSKMASVTTIDLLALATSLPYAADTTAFNSSIQNVTFQSYHPSFSSLLGSNASWTMVANESYQAFHEAGVYDQLSKSLYISSNWAGSFDNPINISILNLEDFTVTSTRYPGLASANGGCTYVPPGTDGPPQLLFCDEGDFNVASGLTVVNPATHTTKVNCACQHMQCNGAHKFSASNKFLLWPQLLVCQRRQATLHHRRPLVHRCSIRISPKLPPTAQYSQPGLPF